MTQSEAFPDIELRNIQAESNGVTTTIEPHGWKWIDQPLVGAAHNGLNVYAITVPTSLANCYRKVILLILRFRRKSSVHQQQAIDRVPAKFRAK